MLQLGFNCCRVTKVYLYWKFRNAYCGFYTLGVKINDSNLIV